MALSPSSYDFATLTVLAMSIVMQPSVSQPSAVQPPALLPTVTRFAPSPTGFLHLGHAASALFAWRHARDAGGRFLLRLEDIDPTRCRPEYAAAILEDLAWLGIDWDGPVRVQSDHMDEYRATLDHLAGRGLTYPCFCSRAAIQQEVAEAAAAPHAPDGSLRYPGTCRALPASERARRITRGEPHVLRLDMAAALAQIREPLSFVDATYGRVVCDPGPFGDVVLARRDAPASYHLCVTHDDALQGVTLVTRGVDLLPATHLHRLLQALMGWPEPAYAHHPLLTDAAGRRLAKRDRAATLRALRSQGLPAEQVRHRAVFQSGGGEPATGGG
jgi:glutamyl-Q tRNA(Asp) synthetase